MKRSSSPLWTCLAVVGATLALPGCSKSSTDVVATTQELFVSSEQRWETGTRTFAWDTNATQARLEVEVHGFHHGSFRVVVLDGAGSTVLDRTYYVWDDVYVIGADTYYDQAFTQTGVAGRYTVRLHYLEFSGHLYLSLRDRATLPAPAPVAPPAAPTAYADSSFGVAGVTSASGDQGFHDRLAVDGQGRIVVAGAAIDAASGARRAAVWRYTSGGQLDPTFGTGGRFVYGSTAAVGLLGLDVDASDRPVVCGWTVDAGGRLDLLLLRLTPTGALDGTFGAGGVVTLNDGEDEVGVGVDHDSQGRVVVGGTRRLIDNSEGAALALRFAPNGTLDAGFGAAGIVRTPNRTDRGRDLAVDASDRPVLLGERNGDLIVWRYTPTGALDLGFGAGGLATDNGPQTEDRLPTSLAIAADGTVAAAGYRRMTQAQGPRDLVVWRFTADGQILTAFNGGVAIADHLGLNGDAAGFEVEVDASGRVVVLGVTSTYGAPQADGSATVWRFLPSGTLDPSLSAGGVVRFDVRQADTVTSCAAGGLDATGRVLAAGVAANVVSLQSVPVAWRLILP